MLRHTKTSAAPGLEAERYDPLMTSSNYSSYLVFLGHRAQLAQPAKGNQNIPTADNLSAINRASNFSADSARCQCKITRAAAVRAPATLAQNQYRERRAAAPADLLFCSQFPSGSIDNTCSYCNVLGTVRFG